MFFDIILRGYFNLLLPFNGSQTETNKENTESEKEKRFFANLYFPHHSAGSKFGV